MSDFDFSIRMNNAAIKGGCPFCDEPHRPDIGPALFYDSAGGRLPICDSCGAKHAPQLALMVSMLNTEFAEMPDAVARERIEALRHQ